MFIERSEACWGGVPTETAELGVIMGLLAGLEALHYLQLLREMFLKMLWPERRNPLQRAGPRLNLLNKTTGAHLSIQPTLQIPITQRLRTLFIIPIYSMQGTSFAGGVTQN